MENNKEQQPIEEVLSRIRFPGEDEQAILDYLESVRFPDRVMERIEEERQIVQKTAVWVAFALFNLMLIVLFGIGGTVYPSVPAVPVPLNNFIFLFLGITFLGSVIGIVLSLDTKWFHRLIHRT